MPSTKSLIERLKKVLRENPGLLEDIGERHRRWDIDDESHREDHHHHGVHGGGGRGRYPRRGSGGVGYPSSTETSGELDMQIKGQKEGPLQIEVVEDEEKGYRFDPKDLLKMPDVEMKKSEVSGDEDEQDIRTMNIKYPLIPNKPSKNERVYAYANIKWDPGSQGLIYHVIEPSLSERDEMLIERIKETLRERLDVSFTKVSSGEAESYLDEKIDEVLEVLGAAPTHDKREVLTYYIKRDFIGLGKIEPLMYDPYIEDISCDGVDIPIYIYHRNPRIASIPTSIQFDDREALDSFVFRLAQKAGHAISMAEPLVDAALPDGSRLQATLSTDIARRGSNFTIRKFTEKPLTPTDIINFGTINSLMMAYLWMCIENGKSMLVSGGTATGKTTMLNVLSLFIRPEMKIVSIEDTPELRLTHPHWVPEVAREAISSAGQKEYGKIDLFDLLKSSLRQRPDYIIVGEVRGREAYVLFQQMATGHTGVSTLHAESLDKLVDRLTTEPINLPPSLIETLDIVIFIKRERRENGYVRRIQSIYEVVGYDRDDEFPVVNEVFKWDPKTDDYVSPQGSYILESLKDHVGKDEAEMRAELKDRTRVMEWMRARDVTDFRDVSKVIRLYYANKEGVMDRVEAELE